MTSILALPLWHVLAPVAANPAATACGKSSQVYALPATVAQNRTDLPLCAVCCRLLQIPTPRTNGNR